MKPMEGLDMEISYGSDEEVVASTGV
jgi:hypothetical protein